jgi:DNA polymerase-3 subunit chi
MTRVDFYVVDEPGQDALLQVACRLAEKAHAAGHRVFIYAEDAALRQRLDELLWTFRQGSFVPHGLLENLDGADDPTPVVIGGEAPPAGADDVIVNLGQRIPDFFSRFERCLELVPAQDRDQARERYRFYQSRGYPLAKHDIQ